MVQKCNITSLQDVKRDFQFFEQETVYSWTPISRYRSPWFTSVEMVLENVSTFFFRPANFSGRICCELILFRYLERLFRSFVYLPTLKWLIPKYVFFVPNFP